VNEHKRFLPDGQRFLCGEKWISLFDLFRPVT